MRNITISLPYDVYKRARVKAAERGTSVSALVREFLTNLGEEEPDFDRRKHLQREVIASIKSFRAGGRLSRHQIHQRDPFS